ncbi:MAG: lysostaphin resistance A-like protein [Thermaurantimonas sp.]
MNKEEYSNLPTARPLWLDLISLTASVFMGIIAGSLIASMTIPMVFKISVEQIADLLLNMEPDPKTGSVLRYIQLWTSGLGFVGGGVFFLARVVKSMDQIGLDIHSLPKPSRLLMALGAMAFLLPLTEWLQWLNNQIIFPESLAAVESNLRILQKANLDQIRLMIEPDNPGLWPYTLIVIAILPAIGEELVFRGALQNLLIRKFGSTRGIVLTALLFTLIHRQFYNILPMFLLALLLGYVYYLTGSLLTTIAMHLLNNALSLFLVYYFGWTDEITRPEFSPALTVVLASAGVYLIFRLQKLVDSELTQ